MVLVPVSLQCNLVSSPKEPSGVITFALLQWCRIIARVRYSNMFFYIRPVPDGAIGDQPMARQGDQPWTFLLYLQLVTTIYSNNGVHTMEF